MNIEVEKTHVGREELRERILTVAMEMFYKSGIKPVRMDDIANNLSISKRTLYEVFQDKETLLLECLVRGRELQNSYMNEVDIQKSNVLEIVLRFYQYNIARLRRINPRFFEDLKKYPQVMNFLRNERNRDFHVVVNYFEKGIEQGIFRKDVNMDLFIRLLNLTFDNTMESDVSKNYSVNEIYSVVVITYLRGISTDKGLKILDEFMNSIRNDN